MSRTPVTIFYLPHVVVEHALIMAPLEDRVRFTATCTRYRQLGAASTALWDLATFDATKVSDAGIASFVAWLASPAGRRLKSLFTFIPRKLWGFAAAPAAHRVQWSNAADVPASTEFDNPPPARLPSRQPALAGSTLPWTDSPQHSLPAAITAATQLESLSLLVDGGPRALNTAGLERLTRLTYLSLVACHLQQPPAALASLYALRALCLLGNPLGGADLSLLAALPALRELDLCFCGLTHFSPDLLCLTGLEALSVSYNPLDLLPAELAGLRHLAAFGCNAIPAVLACKLLSRLSALTSLCLTQLPDDTCAHHLAGLFEDLRCLPHLRVLSLTGGMPGRGPTWSLDRSREVAAPLTAALPALEVQAAHGLSLPAELAVVPWDRVQ